MKLKTVLILLVCQTAVMGQIGPDKSARDSEPNVAAEAVLTTKLKKPNFIFVLSDDIAQGDLGCYGQKKIATPRLDQMASEGTRYMQAYCGTTVCAPSRSSFFTGLHSGHCPVRGNFEIVPDGQFPLPDETVTIAEVAHSAGYATATFGKWGMGFFDTSGAPSKQGVDHFFGYNCQRLAHSYFPTYLHDDDQPFVCLLYTSPSPRDKRQSRMPSSA